MAQPGRAPGSGPGGRRFKSSLPDQSFWIQVKIPLFLQSECPPLQRTQGWGSLIGGDLRAQERKGGPAPIASTSCGSTWAQTFSYDAFGNISKSGSVSWGCAACYNASSNQYNSTLSGTMSYDGNGNLLNDSFNAYTWDAEGKQLSTAYGDNGGTNTFTYDAFGHVVEISEGGGIYISYITLGKHKLSAIGETAFYSEFPLPGGSVYSQGAGATELQLGDWLGTIRASYGYTGGSFEQSGSHAPFGESYSYDQGHPGAFTGQDSDGNLNNTTYYFPERQYRSSQGRWLSPDPAGLNAVDITNPQSWNRYAYVNNMPLNNIDPLGLACWPLEKYNFGTCAGFMNNGVNYGANWDWFTILQIILGQGQTAVVTSRLNGIPVNQTATYYPADLSILSNDSSLLSSIGNWFSTAQFVGVGGSLWIAHPQYPVGWSPGVNFVSDGTKLHSCASLAAGGVGAKTPGGSVGPLFGNPSQAPAIIQGAGLTLNVNLPIPFLGNPGVQIITSSGGTLAGPTFGTPGVSLQVGYSWPCTP